MRSQSKNRYNGHPPTARPLRTFACFSSGSKLLNNPALKESPPSDF